MSMRMKVVTGLAATLVGLMALGAGSFWYLFLRDDAPPAVTLAGAVQSLATPESQTTASGSNTPEATGATMNTGIDGAWTVAEEGETFAGYRVQEELASIGATTAVGRTTEVEAEFVIEDGELSAGTVTADLTALASDKTMRDNALRNQGLQTAQYPTATFVADGGLSLPDALEAGEAVSLTLAGKLTLHGVTKSVEVPLQVQLVDGRLVAVGSIEIVFADYNITRPSAASVLSIEDHGVMEFQIVLEQSGGTAST